MWFSEIRRILKPNGIFYATIHDEYSIMNLKLTKPNEIGYWLKIIVEKFIEKNELNIDSFLRLCVGTKSPGGIQMFYNREHIIKCISNMYSVCEIMEKVGGSRAGLGYQTGLVLRRI